MKKQEYVRMHRVQKLHWWYVTRRNFLQTALASIQTSKKKQILDVGCGTGANTDTLRLFGTIIGLDASTYAKKFYATDARTSFVLGHAQKIPFAHNTFDLVVITDVLYHKNIANPSQVLDEAYRVLKPKGYCLITDCVHPFLFGPHDIHNQARERFTKNRLEQLVVSSGYTILRSSYLFMITFPLFVVSRLLAVWLRQSVPFEETTNTLINRVCIVLGKVDNYLFQRLNLPFGSSVLILAQKISTPSRVRTGDLRLEKALS